MPASLEAEVVYSDWPKRKVDWVSIEWAQVQENDREDLRSACPRFVAGGAMLRAQYPPFDPLSVLSGLGAAIEP